jgi:hypothetical protein
MVALMHSRQLWLRQGLGQPIKKLLAMPSIRRVFSRVEEWGTAMPSIRRVFSRVEEWGTAMPSIRRVFSRAEVDASWEEIVFERERPEN